MRILALTQVLPLPLDAGPKVRAFYVLRYLAEAGHEVHLLSFVRGEDSEACLQDIRRFCASVTTVAMTRTRVRDVRDALRSAVTATPFLVLRDQLPAMRAVIARALHERTFDALHADQLWMAPYAINGSRPGLTVLDQHNAVFMVPSRLAEHHPNRLARALLRYEASKLSAFEQTTCGQFDTVVWVTDEDRRAILPDIRADDPRNPVIPIATDPAAQGVIERPRPFRVTFVGGMHWPPNREGVSWFLERVWPRVARAVPSAVLTLIGRGGSLRREKAYAPDRIHITGYLADPREYLAETAAFIVPLRSGAGMRVKILDAWCWGLPIVSTSVGAEGMMAEDGTNVLVADEAEAFADAVVRVSQSDTLGRRLAANGRATVERYYDWRATYRAWDRVYSA